MKQHNYNESVSKWKNAINAFEKAVEIDDCAYLDLISPCGFCKEFGVKNVSCGTCPLEPEYCTSKRSKQALFWQIIEAYNDCKYQKALDLSRKMLEKIETFNPSLVKDSISEGKR